MKKTLITALAAILLLTLTACSATAATQQTPVTQKIAQEEAPQETPELKSASVPAASADPEATPEALPETGDAVAITTPEPIPVEVNTLLTADEARAIALKHAGLTEEEITFVRTVLDHDDGCTEYEIEFYCGDREYDYDVDACTGGIRGFDTEIEHHAHHTDSHHSSSSAATASTQQTVAVSEDQARSIALDHAGIPADDARFEKIELDKDDGRMEYEIEFHAGGYEYEYEIDAQTGDILKSDKDTDD